MLDRIWRTAATAFCFGVFGAGGALMGLVALPVLRATARDPRACSRQARTLIHNAFRIFVGLMRTVGVISLEVRGAARLRRRGILVLANHPSLIDVVLLGALLEQVNCIVKARLWQNVFTRGPVLAAGYISNREGGQLVEECVAALHRGENLLVFPEGTRTPLDGTIRLLRGAAQIAVRAGCPVAPVVIWVSTPHLTKGAKWCRVPSARPHYVVEVGEDIDVEGCAGSADSQGLAARSLTAWLQDYFAKETRRLALA